MVELFKYNVEQYKTIFMDDKIDIIRGEEEYYDFDVPVWETRKKGRLVKFKVKRESMSHEDYINNYGNPLCYVRKDYITLVVESNSEKVSLKIFEGSRLRVAGRSYFIIDKSMEFITMTKKTGDLYYGTLKHYQKKKKFSKTLSKNNFVFNYSPKLLQTLRNSLFSDEYASNAPKQLIQALDIFVKDLSGWSVGTKSFTEVLLKYYLDKKGIKYPDNFPVFWSQWERKLNLSDLRKHDNKLVDTFMRKNDLKGNSVKKALHVCKKINIPMLNMGYFLFPKDWINQDYELILNLLDFDSIHSFYNHDLGDDIDELNLTRAELRRVFDIFKLTVSNQINLHTFFDHIRYYRELKILGEEVKWLSTDTKTFNHEHSEYTERIDYYRKGTYSRIYPDYMYEYLSLPITVNQDKYYPVLLDETSDYIMESTIQSNCVKNYIGNSGSYIVSLRKGSIDSEIRATIEFRIYKIGDKITFTIPQMLGKFNQKLDEDWDTPILLLRTKFSDCINDERFEPVKIKKTFKNKKELTSDTYWDEMGALRWSSVNITSYYD